MSNQEISIVLEVISFFLVAIDLYGRARLERTYKFLIQLLDKSSGIVNRIRNLEWEKEKEERIKKKVYKVFILIVVLTFLIYPFIFIHDTSLNPDMPGRWFFVIFASFLASTFTAMSIIAIVIALILAIVVGFLVLTWVIRSIVYVFISILSMTKMEGLLLITGSLIFIVSKYYEWHA